MCHAPEAMHSEPDEQLIKFITVSSSYLTVTLLGNLQETRQFWSTQLVFDDKVCIADI